MEKDIDRNYSLGAATNELLCKHYNINCTDATLAQAFKREGVQRFKAA
jgi:hypothetical protein